MSEPYASAVAWLLTYMLHSSLLLGAVALAERCRWLRAPAARELAWRTALFGALLSASLHSGLSLGPRIGLAGDDQDRQVASTPRAAVPSRVDEVGAQPPAYAPLAPMLPINEVLGAAPPADAPAAAPVSRPLAALPDWFAIHWAAALVLAWLAGATLLALRLAHQLRLARRELAARAPLRSGPLADMLRRLSHAADREPPALSHAPTLAGPVSLPNGEICVPDWVLEHLDARQQRALLAHELAHQRRHDPQWLIAALLVASLCWLQPLNLLARRRLAHLAELAADAWAARAVGDGRALAECLAECAARLFPNHSPQFGAAMARPRSPLIERVERLTRGQAMSDHQSRWSLRIAALTTLAAACVLLPGIAVQAGAPAPRAPEAASAPPAAPAPRAAEVPATPRAEREAVAPRAPAAPAGVASAPTPPAPAPRPAGDDWTGQSIHLSDEGVSVSLSRAGQRLALEIEGEVEFTDAEDDVQRLGRGASLSLQERKAGVKREYTVEHGSGGQLVREYRVDGKVRNLDAAGRAWLQATLPGLLRESAIGVEQRVARLYAQGGARAALAVLADIRSDHALARHLTVLTVRHRLDDAELGAALALAARIGSDFELRQTLQALVERPLSSAASIALYRTADSIDSDFELAELLVAGASNLPADAGVQQAWLQAARGLASDFEMRRTLTALARRDGLVPASLLGVLELAAQAIGSDFELREMLSAWAPRMQGADLVRAYARASREVGSDFEQREALTALVREGRLAAGDWAEVLEAARGIGSDFERATLLIEVAKRMPADAVLVRQYRALTGGMGDHERGRAERALLDRITG